MSKLKPEGRTYSPVNSSYALSWAVLLDKEYLIFCIKGHVIQIYLICRIKWQNNTARLTYLVPA